MQAAVACAFPLVLSPPESPARSQGETPPRERPALLLRCRTSEPKHPSHPPFARVNDRLTEGHWGGVSAPKGHLGDSASRSLGRAGAIPKRARSRERRLFLKCPKW